MTVCAGWVVLDRAPGEPWSCRHEGHAWESIDQARAELDACAAWDPDHREWVVARLVPATDIVRGTGDGA